MKLSFGYYETCNSKNGNFSSLNGDNFLNASISIQDLHECSDWFLLIETFTLMKQIETFWKMINSHFSTFSQSNRPHYKAVCFMNLS